MCDAREGERFCLHQVRDGSRQMWVSRNKGQQARTQLDGKLLSRCVFLDGQPSG